MEGDEEEQGGSGPVLPGKVNEIRRQWAVHEDEALAYRLQNEEIKQHYSGNRTRNAIVREDTPWAREEQKREEQHALEDRLRQLQLLQLQAEEDARLAKELAERFDKGLEESMMNNLVSSPVGVSNLPSPSEIGRHTIEHVASSSSAPSSSTSQFPKIKNDLQEKSPPASRYYSQDHNSTSPGSSSSSGSEKKMKSIMKPAGTYRDKEDKIDWSAMGACGYSAPVSPPLAQGTVEKNCNLEESDLPYSLDEEGQRLLQEKLDEELAMKLQKEMEQAEIDKKVALEAQDRELAKMLHQKEKERLRRAKERAKQKAAALAAANTNNPEGFPNSQLPEELVGISEPEPNRTPSRSSSGTSASNGGPRSPSWNDYSPTSGTPPKLPEKPRVDRDDPFSFRAAPRALPPHPPQLFPNDPRRRPTSSGSSPLYLPSDDPIPPYMPLQGLQNLQKRKNK